MVTLTNKTTQHVSHYLTHHGKGVDLRVGVKITDCPGLAYKLEYADEAVTEDQVFESNGVKAIIDPKSLSYIDSTELDCVREELNKGLRFDNPNVKDECDHGESLRV